MKLNYKNKLSKKDIISGKKAKIDCSIVPDKNLLIHGENLNVMRLLLDTS